MSQDNLLKTISSLTVRDLCDLSQIDAKHTLTYDNFVCQIEDFADEHHVNAKLVMKLYPIAGYVRSIIFEEE